VVGIVIVSHSAQIASGTAELAAQMAGPEVRIEPAGGDHLGGLGTDGARVHAAIETADSGAGVVVLGDLGSAILTVQAELEGRENGQVVLADAPLVEGAVAAAVAASAGLALPEVQRCAEEASGAAKL